MSNIWSRMPTSQQSIYSLAFACYTILVLTPIIYLRSAVIFTPVQTFLKYDRLKSQEKRGLVSRHMIARLNQVSNNALGEYEGVSGKKSNSDELPATRKMEIDYCEVCEKEDPFPGASNLDPLYYDNKGNIDIDISDMLNQVDKNDLRSEKKG